MILHWKAKDLSGDIIGKLKVIEPCGRTNSGGLIWLCECECGTYKKVHSNNLNQGRTVSCGCYGKAQRRKAKTTHGLSKTSELGIWRGIKSRCYDPQDPAFHNYGGRGIKMHHTWKKSVARFYKDMGPRPSPKHSIERINNDRWYSPSNCKWGTWEEQANNRRCNRTITFAGETLNLSQWARKIGISSTSLSERLENWTVEESLTIPKGGSAKNITFKGVTLNVSEWAYKINIKPNTLHNRLEKWTIEEALTITKGGRRSC